VCALAHAAARKRPLPLEMDARSDAWGEEGGATTDVGGEGDGNHQVRGECDRQMAHVDHRCVCVVCAHVRQGATAVGAQVLARVCALRVSFVRKAPP
jgi:hypothetical protein